MINFDYCYKATCNIPRTYREAIDSSDAHCWVKAMHEELESLKENNVFELTNLPESKKTVGSKWVYTTKENPDGSKRYKARFVARGFSQKKGIDYGETSPTTNITSIRILMQMVVQYDLIVHQMDVRMAYLHAPIDYEIFVEQPEGFKTNKLVYRLNKSLYELKQSGRNWNKMLHDCLIRNDFIQNPADHCVYMKQNERLLIVSWVEDLIIAADKVISLSNVKKMLMSEFKMKDLGKLNHFIEIHFHITQGCVKMNQNKYIGRVLERFNMSNCKPRATPCELRMDLINNSDPVDSRKYHEIIGSLIYHMTCTRPDLSYAVGKLSQYLSEPSQQLWVAKHILKYLRGTSHYELRYQKSEELRILAYSDADWASNHSDRRSTTGFCFYLNKESSPISWKSKKQLTVALSTCESEFMALAKTTHESLYLIQLLNGMDPQQRYEPAKILGDNQGAITLSKDPVNRQRCKHIDIKYHFIRDA